MFQCTIQDHCVVNETTNDNILINYQKTVALSYQSLDDEINKLYPNLKRTSKQDVRTYVKFLQSKFPKLTDTICENYVDARDGYDRRSRRTSWQSSATMSGRRRCLKSGMGSTRISQVP